MWGAVVDFRFDAEEWIKFNAEEWKALSLDGRARKCRLLAAEAMDHGSKAPEHLKQAFLVKASGWLELAAEIERSIN